MLIHICDAHEDGLRPCFFQDASFRRLSGDMPRCIRHGKMFSAEVNATDVKTAKKFFFEQSDDLC